MQIGLTVQLLVSAPSATESAQSSDELLEVDRPSTAIKGRPPFRSQHHTCCFYKSDDALFIEDSDHPPCERVVRYLRKLQELFAVDRARAVAMERERVTRAGKGGGHGLLTSIAWTQRREIVPVELHESFLEALQLALVD